MSAQQFIQKQRQRIAGLLSRKSFRLLPLFFGCMLLFTVISRTVTAASMPRVEITSFSNGSIDRSVEVAGVVEAKGSYAIYSLEGVRISGIEAETGGKIEAGGLLFSVDLNKLEEQITELETEKEKLSLQLKGIRSEQVLTEKNRQKTAARAREDYETTCRQQQDKVNQAYEELAAATERLAVYQESDKQEVGLDTDGVSREQLEQELSQAEKSYQLSIEEQQQAVKEAERLAEDTKEQTVSDTEEQVIEIDIRQLETKLDNYQKLKEQNGQVSCEQGGTVMQINVEAGDIVTTEPVMMVSDDKKGLRFKGNIMEEQAEAMAGGDAAWVCPDQAEDKRVQVTLAGIGKPETETGLCKVTADLPEDYEGGEGSASLLVEKKGRNYDTCVQLEAVYMDNGGTYVLAVEERATVLGISNTVSRHDIMVAEQGAGIAAVEGNLPAALKIILKSDKPLQEGDRVRLAGE